MQSGLKQFSALTFPLLFAMSVQAQPAADFYRGKTVTVLVGIEPGTGYDLYGRTLARYIGRHIPGNPTVIVSNMPGASGLVAFNWLANVAPRDGSLFATASLTVPFEPIFGNARALFDATKFGWVGNMDSSVSVCAIRLDSGLSSFDDMMSREILIGGTGSAGPISQFPLAVRNLTGAKIKLIEGYKGTASVKLAIERKEVFGICGLSFSTIRTQYKELVESGQLKVVVQMGAGPRPDLPGVPYIYQFAKTAEDRQVYDLVFGPQNLGRSFAAPQGVPSERLRDLRDAFNAAVKDPDLLAEAAKINLDLSPQTGEEVQAFIERAYASPPNVVERARKAVQN